MLRGKQHPEQRLHTYSARYQSVSRMFQSLVLQNTHTKKPRYYRGFFTLILTIRTSVNDYSFTVTVNTGAPTMVASTVKI